MPQKILDILSLGPATTTTLAAATGTSRQTVGRKLRALGDMVIKYDKVRPPLYFAAAEAFGSGSEILLTAVDPSGNTDLWGVLRPLANGGFYLEPAASSPKVLAGAKCDGMYDDLPYFLDDLRPQGFMGRQIARKLNVQSDMFPQDPRDWNQEQTGRYLVANGDDLPGNLNIGRMALDRVKRPPHKVRREDYPELAEKALEGEIHGSSAGGEQPKFAIYSRERDAHVIVKFSPEGNDKPALRWKDILVTEHIASALLHEYNFPAAEIEIFEKNGRLFLESRRVDRTGEHGRLSLISMQAIDNEFSGAGSGWLDVAHKLHSRGLITRKHLHDIGVYWGFGTLIYNTDMHLGNISFSIEDTGFNLAPIYDMCSMGFCPTSGGEVPPFSFSIPDIDAPLAFSGEAGAMIKEMARDFWTRLVESELISPEFKMFIYQSGLTEPVKT